MKIFKLVQPFVGYRGLGAALGQNFAFKIRRDNKKSYERASMSW